MAGLKDSTESTGELFCSLDERALAERLEEIRRTLVPALIESRRVDRGLRLVLEDGDGLRGRIERLIELEGRCCSFLAFELGRAAEGRLRLDITGPPGAKGVLTELAEALGAGR